MKYILLILTLFMLTGCVEPKLTLRDKIKDDKEACFDAGGFEYHTGTSGGDKHNVCVFKR